ncbi:uncharacterized protein LOC119774984 [Cyprinodon tularosa]|uniref:uncharacterized protein LOC119774984 n=1 Tax=Cyprinodon tularosa TaxID=77115 RepID=UPI0018E24A56|nr:uncharacterized protein LOC119774984 [Cyprinodon tularosa]
MADGERRGLVWDIKKSLLTLTADELFQLARSVGPVPGKDASTLQVDEEDRCFEYIRAFMDSDTLMQLEDSGMATLLELNDTVKAIQRRAVKCKTTADDVHNLLSTPGFSEYAITDDMVPSVPNTNMTQPAEVSPAVPLPFTTPSLTHPIKTIPPTDTTELQKMLTTFLQHINNTTLPPTLTPTPAHHTPLHSTLPPDTKHAPVQHAPKQNTHDKHDRGVPLRELSMLRREFKVQGGQIGDQSSDLSYSNICRQIDDGVKDQFSDAEILRGILRVIKPGHFKDMLMHKDDLTIDEMKCFLQSHLGGQSNTELFQELMCTKQNDSETPQQFLYRVIGLKQKILFASKHADTEVKYNSNTVKDIFLHTIYQGLSQKHNDIRRELKTLLSDSSVSDEEILKQMMKITSTENERQRRLGSGVKQKQVSVHSTELVEVEVAAAQGNGAKKDAPDKQPKANALQLLTEQVAELMTKVEQLQRPQQIYSSEPCHHCKARVERTKPKSNSCANCLAQNLPGCTHCFYCGENGHRAVGCLKKPKRQENWSRSLQRDNQ